MKRTGFCAYFNGTHQSPIFDTPDEVISWYKSKYDSRLGRMDIKKITYSFGGEMKMNLGRNEQIKSLPTEPVDRASVDFNNPFEEPMTRDHDHASGEMKTEKVWVVLRDDKFSRAVYAASGPIPGDAIEATLTYSLPKHGVTKERIVKFISNWGSLNPNAAELLEEILNDGLADAPVPESKVTYKYSDGDYKSLSRAQIEDAWKKSYYIGVSEIELRNLLLRNLGI